MLYCAYTLNTNNWEVKHHASLATDSVTFARNDDISYFHLWITDGKQRIYLPIHETKQTGCLISQIDNLRLPLTEC